MSEVLVYEEVTKEAYPNQRLIQRICQGKGWSCWQPLEGSWRGTTLPITSGLYCVRVVLPPIYAQILYIGQSGNLRERLSMLAHVFSSTMPFRTPHVAGPGLWALRHRAHLEHKEIFLESSVFSFDQEIPKSLRLGCEALVISLYRQRYGRSPFLNYSKMIDGYVTSSYNTGPEKSYRGTPSPLREKSHLPSLAPAGPLLCEETPSCLHWCGHEWSEWIEAPLATLPEECVGLYRVRSSGGMTLLYVGQGKLRDRLKKYRDKDVECSWAVKSPCAQGYQEYVDDAIAAHVLAIGEAPTWQFAQE